MGRKIVLAVLCGLPGSGKSCLAKLIKMKYDHLASEWPSVCCVVCYDHLLHRSLEEQLIASDVTKAAARAHMHQSKWKEYRESIVSAVEALMCETLQKDPPNKLLLNSEARREIVSQLRDKIGFVSSDRFDENDRFLFVIDDNMYFKSMRYEYYKLARKYNVGFCQIHVQCRLEVAIERNQARTEIERVEDSVINSMNVKFEAPDPIENMWEAITISTGNDYNDDHFLSFWPKLESFLQTAFDNPVISRVEDELERKATSREACSRSVLHQVDKILRKLVSKEMRKSEGKKSDAARLNEARQMLLNEIKKGEFGLNVDVKRRIECGQIQEVEPLLYHVLDEAFHHKLANKTT